MLSTPDKLDCVDDCPLVSIILPAYNHERYIDETLRSLIAQSYKNVELLVIDDGSPDNTWSRLLALKPECNKRFVHVVMEHRENKGLCATYNELIDLSRGEYLFVVNSDDVAKEHAIERLVAFLKSAPDYAVAVGDNEFIDEKSQVVYWDEDKRGVYVKGAGVYLTFNEYLSKTKKINSNSYEFGRYDTLIWKGNHITNGYLIKKSIFEQVGYYTNKAPIEDYYIFLQIAKYSKIKYINEVLLSYRWHKENTILKRPKEYRFEDRTFLFEKSIVDQLGRKDISDIFYGYIYRKKKLIGFPKLVAIYKIKNMLHKKFILEIFGLQLTIYCQNRRVKNV